MKLDAESDINLLRENTAIDPQALRMLRYSYFVLQAGVAADLTLFEIAHIIARDDLDVPSLLEEALSLENDRASFSALENAISKAVFARACSPSLTEDSLGSSFTPVGLRSPALVVSSEDEFPESSPQSKKNTNALYDDLTLFRLNS